MLHSPSALGKCKQQRRQLSAQFVKPKGKIVRNLTAERALPHQQKRCARIREIL